MLNQATSYLNRYDGRIIRNSQSAIRRHYHMPLQEYAINRKAVTKHATGKYVQSTIVSAVKIRSSVIIQLKSKKVPLCIKVITKEKHKPSGSRMTWSNSRLLRVTACMYWYQTVTLWWKKKLLIHTQQQPCISHNKFTTCKTNTEG